MNALANVAMDSGRSFQILGPEVAMLPLNWASVTNEISNNLGDWHEWLWNTADQATRQVSSLGRQH